MSDERGHTPPPVHKDGIILVDGAVRRVTRTDEPPRLPGNDCGCWREKTSKGWTLHLCDPHGREPGIAAYCLGAA